MSTAYPFTMRAAPNASWISGAGSDVEMVAKAARRKQTRVISCSLVLRDHLE